MENALIDAMALLHVNISKTRLIAVDLKGLRFLTGAGTTAQAADRSSAGSARRHYRCLRKCRLKSPLLQPPLDHLVHLGALLLTVLLG